MVNLPHFDSASCFPVEAMHTCFSNTAKYMARHWSCAFFKGAGSAALQHEDFNLSKPMWTAAGKDLKRANPWIPASLGRHLRDISKHINGYKATEWQEWTLLYSIPVMQGRLPPVYLKHWARFVLAM